MEGDSRHGGSSTWQARSGFGELRDRDAALDAEDARLVAATWHENGGPSPGAGIARARGATTYPATKRAVGLAQRDVVRVARAAGASESKLVDIELAVSEAATNAVMHAYVSPGIRGETFTITTAAEDTIFTVWVTDEGRGMAPDAANSGLGVGLKVMARMCEHLAVGVQDDGRTQVEMRFALDGEAILLGRRSP
jgi:anti-sigma regulatory factor (Ser/Thr protein kinase)